MTKYHKYCIECGGYCCKENEMILSEKDIKKIILMNPKISKKEDIVFINSEGFYQLKNKDFRCIFYNEQNKECEIYNFRPQGCKFYPLIYNLENDQCLIDKDCPYSHIFYKDSNNIKVKCRKLKIFIRKELNI
jgi:Fe-S-cluster containining protein